MKCLIIVIPVFLYFTTVSADENPHTLFNEFGDDVGMINVEQYFKPSDIKEMRVLLDPEALLNQIDEVLYYIENHGHRDPAAVSAGLFTALGITLPDIKATVRFIAKILREDKKNKKQRLQDPDFLRRHFKMIRWYPHGKNNPGKKIRITKYAVFKIKGLFARGALYQHALYGLPYDEAGLTPEDASKKGNSLNRFRYTKQEVLAGVYNDGQAPVLAWVTRKGLESALLEGSVSVEFPDGNHKYFNVDRNNGISWNHGIKNPWEQKRYWYFKEVNRPKGYGMNSNSQVAIFPNAAIAGDIYNLGLGKIMGISCEGNQGETPMLRLGILADTGGAFTPNLHQIDLYTGIFNNEAEFKNRIKSIPHYAAVYFFILKSRCAKKRSPL